MTLYSNPDHEVIYRILELLPTVEEALQHMIKQIDELRLVGAGVLFGDATPVICSIASNFILLTTEQDAWDSLQSTVHIREAIGAVTDSFEANNLTLIYNALVNHLLPAFSSWRQQVVRILQPSIMS